MKQARLEKGLSSLKEKGISLASVAALAVAVKIAQEANVCCFSGLFGELKILKNLNFLSNAIATANDARASLKNKAS